ncbi:hypothetical protein Mgra_00008906 [Meloidogyne graminicola]|uniref:Uncharacterized protein n=1 Tax=Meloidogyne graminicola TaxID=189291 RepID=A0A8S9ZED7_9BILA|nr:hypothetical protein Mgra_00008906 [Meloidogyne graminicola]
MPCELMEELDFGTALNYASLRQHNEEIHPNVISSSMLDSNILLERNGILSTLQNERSLMKRYSRGKKERQLCEKRFTYYCPTTLLTISMDFLVKRIKRDINQNNPTNESGHRCCVDYKLENDKCVKESGVFI